MDPKNVPLPTLPSPPDPARSPRDFFALIIGGIIILTLGLAGGFYLGKRQKQTASLLYVSPALQVAPNITADWPVYKNDRYGLSLKYPLTFFVQSAAIDTNSADYYRQYSQGLDDPDGVFVVRLVETQYKDKEFHYPEIGVQIYQTKLTPQEWADKNGSSGTKFYLGAGGVKTAQVGDISVIQFETEATSSHATHTLIKNRHYLFDIYKTATGIGDIPDDIYSQVLSTVAISNPVAPAVKTSQ
ncbi:hypothetical protein HY214_00845 [Candidatus Roizmanbacteria bacterium]|nr:hypothetical protein [Candidatus Roizmanbacteria bacterium]